MSNGLPPDVIERFNRGEANVVDALHRAYEPYLRAVVRRLLSGRFRSQFDSHDVVQSVWVQVVRKIGEKGWTVENEQQLRALLTTIARRRLIGRLRKRHSEIPHTEPSLPVIAEASRNPRPSEIVQSDELWDQLLQLCPPEHRIVLELRRQGLRLNEIAGRTGLHEGSVRRILRQLSRTFALRSSMAATLLVEP